MQKLIRGILDFRKNVLPSRRETFAKLAKGQSPDVLFITCSDSRVAPNWFASTDPGDLFVIRNVGNLVPPCNPTGKLANNYSVAAAIDFALNNLKIKDIVVCGHSGCGAIHAVCEGCEKVDSVPLREWLSIAQPALTSKYLGFDTNVTLSVEDRISQKNVMQQIENLKTYPNIRSRVEDGTLKLHGWWFDIAQAGVFAYREEYKQFALIDDKIAADLLSRYS